MHSQAIRQAHEAEYKDFFESNDLVLSGCYSVSWGNDLVDHQSAFPSIQTKVPLRCYVGFRQAPAGTARFTRIRSYDHPESKFDRLEYRAVNPEFEDAERKIGAFLKENGVPFGVEIEFLTEIPRGHSFGFTETSFAITSLGCHLLAGRTGRNEIDDLRASASWKSVVDFAWMLSIGPRSTNFSAN